MVIHYDLIDQDHVETHKQPNQRVINNTLIKPLNQLNKKKINRDKGSDSYSNRQ